MCLEVNSGNMKKGNSEAALLVSNSTGWNWNFNTIQTYKDISFVLYEAYRIGLTNFRGVIARMWFNVATASDRLSFASVERQKLFVDSTQGLSPNCQV